MSGPPGRHPRRPAALTRVTLVLLALLLSTAAVAVAPRNRQSHPAPAWGLAGPYAGVDPADLRHRGVTAVLVEMSWARAEPVRGAPDTRYLDAVDAEVTRFRSAGLQVALNYGMQEAPGWLLALPDARYVDQHGAPYTSEPLADMVFNRALRRYAEGYTDAVMRRLGSRVSLVRVGGGHYGELGYPPPRPGTRNAYWSFSGPARREAPTPLWRPCTPGSQQVRERYLDWYLDALVEYQNWQVRTVRRTYSGTIGVLYPSVGFTEQDRRGALSDGLCGRTPAETGDDVQRGFDHRRQVAALSGPGVVIYCTWADNPKAVASLGQLARARGLPLAGENSGFDDARQLTVTVREARRWRFQVLFWIRAEMAYCRCRPWATIEDYQRAIG